MAQWIKDPALSLQRHGSLLCLGFRPWLRNFHMPRVRPPKFVFNSSYQYPNRSKHFDDCYVSRFLWICTLSLVSLYFCLQLSYGLMEATGSFGLGFPCSGFALFFGVASNGCPFPWISQTEAVNSRVLSRFGFKGCFAFCFVRTRHRWYRAVLRDKV